VVGRRHVLCNNADINRVKFLYQVHLSVLAITGTVRYGAVRCGTVQFILIGTIHDLQKTVLGSQTLISWIPPTPHDMKYLGNKQLF
jgi:hypothetical protein